MDAGGGHLPLRPASACASGHLPFRALAAVCTKRPPVKLARNNDQGKLFYLLLVLRDQQCRCIAHCASRRTWRVVLDTAEHTAGGRYLDPIGSISPLRLPHTHHTPLQFCRTNSIWLRYAICDLPDVFLCAPDWTTEPKSLARTISLTRLPDRTSRHDLLMPIGGITAEDLHADELGVTIRRRGVCSVLLASRCTLVMCTLTSKVRACFLSSDLAACTPPRLVWHKVTI
jgi:hypothetical protein